MSENIKSDERGEVDPRDLKIRELESMIDRRNADMEKVITSLAFVMLAMEGLKDAIRPHVENRKGGGGIL